MSRLHRSIFWVSVFICLTRTVIAQGYPDPPLKRPVNAVFMNVAGGATYFSLEYERLFGRGKPVFISAGAGLGEAMETYPDTYYMTMPLHVSCNAGDRASFFEFGAGSTLIFNHPYRNSISYLILGYRLALPVKHKIAFAFRLNLNIPFDFYDVISEGDPQFIPLGFGFGISF